LREKQIQKARTGKSGREEIGLSVSSGNFISLSDASQELKKASSGNCGLQSRTNKSEAAKNRTIDDEVNGFITIGTKQQVKWSQACNTIG
jgi:hypothetical protein